MTHQVSQRQQRSHEDIYTIGKIGPFRYYAIFDGHGGRMDLTRKHTAYYAAEYLNRFLAVSFSDIDLTNVTLVKECIIETFTDFDEHMFYNKTENGSCCTCVLIGLGKIYQINLGDSRSIIFRGNQLISATTDHTPSAMEGERARIIRKGGAILGNRVHGVLAVSRAFGDFELKKIDGKHSSTDGFILAVPDIVVTDIQEGMKILLTSDAPFEGNKFTNSSLVEEVNRSVDLDRVALSISTTCTDDITLILVTV